MITVGRVQFIVYNMVGETHVARSKEGVSILVYIFQSKKDFKIKFKLNLLYN